MAKALIDSLASDFDADAYHDQYREELLSLIERKAKGESIVSRRPRTVTPTKAPDLMAALEESLAAVRDEETKSNGKAKAEAKKPAAEAEIAKQGQNRQVEVDGREIALTNLDKVLWPECRRSPRPTCSTTTRRSRPCCCPT